MRDERGSVTVERRRELHEPRKVLLAHLLAVTQLVGRTLEPAGLDGGGTHRVGSGLAGALEPAAEPARGVALEQRRTLKREPRVVQQLLEVGQPCVRARE